MKRYIYSAYDNDPWAQTEYIKPELSEAVQAFIDEDIEDIKKDYDFVTIRYAAQDFFNEYRKIDDWNTIKHDDDKGRFYKKYLPFVQKCKEVYKSINPSGYGRHDALLLKIRDICRNVDYNFPYGWKVHSVRANTDVNKNKKVTASELPAGYLRTTRFSTPSIKTDDQRNALEAFEVAVANKFDQFDKFMERQMYLTSDSSWSGYIEVYPEGYYVSLEGTRSSFQAFVSKDLTIRKPRKLSPMEGYYDVNGNAGQVYYMSSLRRS